MTGRVPTTLLAVGVIAFALPGAACSGAPGEQGLRDSFAEQLAANRFVREYQRNGDEMTFIGPGPEGGTAKWRVHIDSGVVEPNDDKKMPYKGTIHSSWYADGQKIEPGTTQSNLPFELTSNGLSQDPWAFWDPAANKWGW
jgi:hypothetical protein